MTWARSTASITTSARARTVTLTPAAAAGYRHLDDIGREAGQPVPPRCGQSAGGCTLAEGPHRGPDTRRVGERAVVDEVDTTRTPAPRPGLHTLVHRLPAQACPVRLRQGDNPVVGAKQFVEHTGSDAQQSLQVPFLAISA